MSIIINGRGRVGARVTAGGSSGGGTDVDAQAFITAASLTDSTQISAVNTLVTGLKSAGIWSKMTALYPLIGGNATAHSYNLSNPSQYRINWYGGWTHNSNGITGNGTNSNGFIELRASNLYSSYQNSLSMGVSVRNNTNNGADISAQQNGSWVGLELWSKASDAIYHSNFDTFFNGIQSISTSVGITISNRIGNTKYIIKNGNVINTSVSPTDNTNSGNQLLVAIGGANRTITGLSGVTALPYTSDKNYDTIFIGHSMNNSEMNSLTQLIDAFNTTLGRKV